MDYPKRKCRCSSTGKRIKNKLEVSHDGSKKYMFLISGNLPVLFRYIFVVLV